jgi:hypothetical protein
VVTLQHQSSRELLANTLDALDRLYDRKTSVVDLHALILATLHRVEEPEIKLLLGRAAEALREILRQRLPSDQENLLALDKTDELRTNLAQHDQA